MVERFEGAICAKSKLHDLGFKLCPKRSSHHLQPIGITNGAGSGRLS